MLADRFVLEHELGSGGMARVYLGRDEVLDRPVAVKVLNPVHGGTDIGARFEREGRTAARLAHPNIVQVYDAGETLFNGRETSYIVMEYVPGGDLKELIDAMGRLPGSELSRLGDEVCAGLAHAHERGVIHRDIKPHNILLDEKGHAKVTDFGVARALDTSQQTRTGSFLGTALYSSPEQLEGQKVTPKSDVYSLGVTLYQATTGEPPFSGATPIEIASQHVSKPPVPPRQLGADISGGVEVLILDCLAKHPDDRPTAEEVRSRLDAEIPTAAAAPPQLAALPTPPTREEEQTQSAPAAPPPGGGQGGASRGGRRRRGILALLAILAVLAVVGALAAPGFFGGEGAGSNGSGQNNAQAGGNAGASNEGPGGQANGGAGGDQGAGGGQSTSPTATASAQPSASAGASSPGEQDVPAQGDFTAQAAEVRLQKIYTTAASGDFNASYSLLSQNFKTTEQTTKAGWANIFADLQSIRFVEGPDAQVSGNFATVTGVTIAKTTDQTERNTVTWRMVREDGGWKLDEITSFRREIISG